MKARLDKILSNFGLCSRSEAKKFIYTRKVRINGLEKISVDSKVEPKDILIDDKPLEFIDGITILMNKPSGVVCSHDEYGKMIYDLLPSHWLLRTPKISTVGRLDKDTTGAIIITDDGELIHKLSSPRKKIKKIYKVELERVLDKSAVELLESGTIILNGEKKPCLPVKLELIDEKNVFIELYEGKYHQVKRMFGAVGNKVLKLHRSGFGSFCADDLAFGEYKIIDKEIIKGLIDDFDDR